ncbi:dimethyl sulfoxide reductase anchor subunit family protein [Desulfocurvibacter africanus]|uniref:dimethyl sulfoxide reductase anchor subunit family protein n=1 Tax=Desulfocurvibacter africanus TaxID=873 RepID=UPI000426C7D2|nr:DmsC/YnfH family molybdoenzyme membrane anchor subunit [Desulfocurvibacter africanus]
MSSLEIPLVLFTVLAQAAVGTVLVSGLRQHAAPGLAGDVRREWFTASGILLLGLAASLFHLGHPLGALGAIKHLSRAWLSREVLGTGLFLALAVAGALTAREKIGKVLVLTASLVGLLAVFAMGMTYAPPSYPALNNALPLVFFLLTALLLGSGVAALFSPESRQPMLCSILGVSLIIALVVYLVVPCVWLSGSTVMAATGKAWMSSPLYWGRIVVGLVLPLVVLWKARRVPAWLLAPLLAGELMGRMIFFAATVHTATSIGGLY